MLLTAGERTLKPTTDLWIASASRFALGVGSLTEGLVAMLNRSAIILIPKQPYADWANSLDEDGPRFEISEANDELTVFLGPDLDIVDEIDAFVTKHFDFFFEHWLFGWSTDPAQWPQRRTRRMFHEWFDVRIHTMVEDVVDAPYEVD